MGELCFSLMLETGKSKRDRHDRQYNQGGKHRPNNPNRRKGANERKK